MNGSVKRRFLYNDWFAFNEVCRDRWVREQLAALPRGSRVLDIGAGAAPYQSALAHCEYRTQDFAALLPEQLRGGSYTQVDYVCDAAAIPVADASFDVILSTEMLEHVPDPIQVAKEIGRILKPGGRLILTAPLGSGIHQEPYHFYGGYTPYWYKRFLAEAGFESIEVRPNAGFFRHFGQESLRFLQLSHPGKMPHLLAALWAPVWICLLPILGVGLPVLCRFLDRFDREQRFTVGYFVTAIKRKVNEIA